MAYFVNDDARANLPVWHVQPGEHSEFAPDRLDANLAAARLKLAEHIFSIDLYLVENIDLMNHGIRLKDIVREIGGKAKIGDSDLEVLRKAYGTLLYWRDRTRASSDASCELMERVNDFSQLCFDEDIWVIAPGWHVADLND